MPMLWIYNVTIYNSIETNHHRVRTVWNDLITIGNVFLAAQAMQNLVV